MYFSSEAYLGSAILHEKFIPNTYIKQFLQSNPLVIDKFLSEDSDPYEIRLYNHPATSGDILIFINGILVYLDFDLGLQY